MTAVLLERYLIDPAFRDGLDADVRTLVEAMRDSHGFLWADAGGSLLHDEAVTLVAEWRTDDDLDAFLAGPAYAAFCKANDVRLREAATRRRLRSAGAVTMDA